MTGNTNSKQDNLNFMR